MPLAPRGTYEVLANASRIAESVREPSGLVALTRAGSFENYVDAVRAPVDLPLHLPQGGIPSAGLALHDGFQRTPHDLELVKRQWSAFYDTELDLQLRYGTDTVIVGSMMTNFGVESTARDAWQHNYAVIIAEDACVSVSQDLHDFAIRRILPRVSRVRSTEAIVAG
jgi:nicotinamidase-related amidase